MYGVVNRCDYRKPVSGDEVSTSRRERRLGSTHVVCSRESSTVGCDLPRRKRRARRRFQPHVRRPPSQARPRHQRRHVLDGAQFCCQVRSKDHTRSTRGRRGRRGEGWGVLVKGRGKAKAWRRATTRERHADICALRVYLRSYACVAALPPDVAPVSAHLRAPAYTGLCTYIDYVDVFSYLLWRGDARVAPPCPTT